MPWVIEGMTATVLLMCCGGTQGSWRRGSVQSRESSVPVLRVSGDLARWRGGMEVWVCLCNSGSVSAVSEKLLEKKMCEGNKMCIGHLSSSSNLALVWVMERCELLEWSICNESSDPVMQLVIWFWKNCRQQQSDFFLYLYFWSLWKNQKASLRQLQKQSRKRKVHMQKSFKLYLYLLLFHQEY